jgi:hypothetical protein
MTAGRGKVDAERTLPGLVLLTRSRHWLLRSRHTRPIRPDSPKGQERGDSSPGLTCTVCFVALVSSTLL